MSWTTVPLRKLLTQSSKRNRTDLPLLSVVREKGVVIRSLDKSENHNIIPDDLSNYKVVSTGQFVINKMKAWQGSCGVSQFDGIVSPAYYVFDLKIDNTNFFNYAIRSRRFVDEFGRVSKGIRVGQWDLDLQQLKYVLFSLPSREAQDQIVRFLDWKVSQINKLINTKRRQIALLQEQKRVIINKSITNVDDNWETMRFRFLCKITTGNKDTINRNDRGVYPFYVRSPKIERINTYSYDGEAILMAGDGVGAGRVFHYACGRFDYHQRVYCFYDFIEQIFVRYLYYYMSGLFPLVVDEGTAKSTVDSIRLNMIQNFPVAFPSMTKQRSIVTTLDKQCELIDNLIDKVKNEIAVFIEYRTCLISDVVTGKLDVRDVLVPEYESVTDHANDKLIEDENFAGDDEE